ncbi:acyl-CoA dehydrogenase family protein [Nocardioides hungaricus]
MTAPPTTEAQEFAGAVADLFDRYSSTEALREAHATSAGRVPALREHLARMGVPGLSISPAHGGLGADAEATTAILIEAGRRAVSEPLIEHVVAAAVLGSSDSDLADLWLPRLAAGTAEVAIGLAEQPVPGARTADLLLMIDGDAAWAVDPASVELAETMSVDPGMRPCSVTWSKDGAQELAPGSADIARRTVAVAAAAQLLGLSEAMLDAAVAWALVREQFGRKIGGFQAVKHELASVYAEIAFCRPVVLHAAASLASSTTSADHDASHAALRASRVSRYVARAALQVHGAVGYTQEHDLHLFMTRAWAVSSVWADPVRHLYRITQELRSDQLS